MRLADFPVLLMMLAITGTLLWRWYKDREALKEKSVCKFYYTFEVERSLDKIHEINERLKSLEGLQTELDISTLDNCTTRPVTLKWDSMHPQKDSGTYVLDLAEQDKEQIERIIEQEREKLTTSLLIELETVLDNGTNNTRT